MLSSLRIVCRHVMIDCEWFSHLLDVLRERSELLQPITDLLQVSWTGADILDATEKDCVRSGKLRSGPLRFDVLDAETLFMYLK